MISQPVQVETVGDLAVLRRSSSSGVEYVVDLPFDVDLFDHAPSVGPYETSLEAVTAAQHLWDLISNACD